MHSSAITVWAATADRKRIREFYGRSHRITMDSALNRLCGAPHNKIVVMIVARRW